MTLLRERPDLIRAFPSKKTVAAAQHLPDQVQADSIYLSWQNPNDSMEPYRPAYRYRLSGPYPSNLEP